MHTQTFRTPPEPLSVSCRPGDQLDWAAVASVPFTYEAGATVFAQGGTAASVLWVQSGRVRLSVLSRRGREAVVAILGPGHFFGESCLAGQMTRMETATAMMATTVLVATREAVTQRIRNDPRFAAQFLTHMLKRSMRAEQDLADQLLNASDKRLARTLLLLERDGEAGSPTHPVPRVSQEVLAEMVGTTRSRVNVFMNRFRKLGLVDYGLSGTLTINPSLRQFVDCD